MARHATTDCIGRLTAPLVLGILLVAGMLGEGCTSQPRATVGADALRLQNDQAKERAERYYASGLSALDDQRLQDAKGFFERALQANPFHGAAQNDLGVVYYRLGDYYSAAMAFDAAAALLRRYEPYYNMGVVLEAAGRLREAVEAYRTAHQMDPGNTVVMGNLVRTYVRMGEENREVLDLTESALMREKRPDWHEWLLLQRARLTADLTGRDSRLDAARGAELGGRVDEERGASSTPAPATMEDLGRTE